jgi:WD40 repeat protein
LCFSDYPNNNIYYWDYSSSSDVFFIGKHESTVSKVKWASAVNLLFSGSFDQTVRWWDARCTYPVQQMRFSEKISAMDIRDYTLVVAGSDGLLESYDIRKPSHHTYQEVSVPDGIR